MVEDEVALGGIEVGVNPPWDPWLPVELAVRLRGVDVPWCVVAGWALDLFRGQASREHEDLEIAVPAGRFDLIRAALADYEFDVVGAGKRWPLDSPAFDIMHQTWVREPATGIYRLDIFREPHDGDIWICRREESIRLPYDQIILTSAEGVPYLVPEVVLLFKAKHDRPKDHADFAGVLPLLDPARQAWLASALARVHPGHRWIKSTASTRMSFLYRETPRAFRPMESALSEDRQNRGTGRLPTTPGYHEGEQGRLQRTSPRPQAPHRPPDGSRAATNGSLSRRAARARKGGLPG